MQSVILSIAATWIEQEKEELAMAKRNYLAEVCTKPSFSGNQTALMVSSPRPARHLLIATLVDAALDQKPAVMMRSRENDVM